MTDLRSRLTAALGPGYRLGRELSGGGMSRVFLAEEIALDREVVVKLPSPALVGEEFVERFRLEILQTARLQHPSIVPLLSAGTVEYAPGAHGPYYLMPYIRGESLRSRLEREGAMSTGATVRVLRDMLEALVQAHSHGVVHRDLKPENVFISGGHAVVTDFGIAKALALREENAEGRTAPGMAIGTPTYMAPEQALGDPDIDHRADLYAVGLVGYEMLTGRPPFGSMPSRQIVAAHANTAPAPLGAQRPGLPSALSDAIMRCLEKDPESRWQSADELLRVIENVPLSDHGEGAVRATTGPRTGGWHRWAIPAAGLIVLLAAAAAAARYWPTSETPPLVTVAVLLPDVGEDSAQLGQFATEFQEEVTHDLRWVNGLEVLDYLALEGVRGEEPRSAASRLGVDYLVRTRLLPEGTGVSLRVNLVDARGVQIWNRAFDIPKRGDFHQSHQRITDSLAIALGRAPAIGAQDLDGPTRSGEAYALYRDAQKAIRVRTRDSLLSAMAELGRALTLNPAFGEAHAELSNAYSLAVVWSYRLPITLYEAAGRALAHADRAIVLAPTLARASVARANVKNQVLAPAGEVRADFARARDLDPGAQPGWYAGFLVREGKGKEALEEAQRGVALDPGSGARHLSLSFDALALGDNALAVAAADSALRIDPTLSLALALRARALLAGEQYSRCVSVDVGPYLGARAACLAALGRNDEAQELVDSLVHRIREPTDSVTSPVVLAQELAIFFAAAGEASSAAYWVREAFELSPIGVDHRLLRSGLFARVMGDRAFQSMVAELQEQAYPRVRAEADRLRRAGAIP